MSSKRRNPTEQARRILSEDQENVNKELIRGLKASVTTGLLGGLSSGPAGALSILGAGANVGAAAVGRILAGRRLGKAEKQIASALPKIEKAKEQNREIRRKK